MLKNEVYSLAEAPGKNHVEKEKTSGPKIIKKGEGQLRELSEAEEGEG